MLPKGLEALPESSKPYLAKKQLFMVDLVNPDSDQASYTSKGRTKELMSAFISPILLNSDELFLYPDDSGNPDERFLSAYNGMFKRDRSRYRVLQGEQLLEDSFVGFWQDRSERRGSLVMILPNWQALQDSVFQNCYDPIVLNNPEAYCGCNAIRFARSRVSESEDLLCVTIPPSLKRALFIQSGINIFDLYSTAASRSNYSNGFLATYGAKAG